MSTGRLPTVSESRHQRERKVAYQTSGQLAAGHTPSKMDGPRPSYSVSRVSPPPLRLPGTFSWQQGPCVGTMYHGCVEGCAQTPRICAIQRFMAEHPEEPLGPWVLPSVRLWKRLARAHMHGSPMEVLQWKHITSVDNERSTTLCDGALTLHTGCRGDDSWARPSFNNACRGVSLEEVASAWQIREIG